MTHNAQLQKSHSVAVLPMLVALGLFKEKGFGPFIGYSEDQRYLLSLLSDPKFNMNSYSKDDIQCCVSNNAAELNAFLAEKNFDIRLDETLPLDLGVVTILDLVAEWLSPGIRTSVKYENQTYPAALIKQGASIVTATDGSPVIMVRTKGDYVVFLEKADSPRSGIALFKHIQQIFGKLTHSEKPCDLTIPFVDMDEQPDMEWVIGLTAENTNFAINQCLQQNRLKINCEGLHAESATAMGGVRGISLTDRPSVVLDSPFNIWICQGAPELGYFPAFAAYVAPDAWKEPK